LRPLIPVAAVILLVFGVASACKKKSPAAAAPPAPTATYTPGTPTATPTATGTPTATMTPTVTGTPACTGNYAPTPVAEAGTPNDSIAQAQVIPAVTQFDFERVITGSVSASGDTSDFYQFSDSYYTFCKYVYLDCFDDGGASKDFDLYIYDAGGNLLVSYTGPGTQIGACGVSGAGPFLVEVRAVSGSGSYRLVLYPT
jgi:hypothetical protein